MQSDHLLHSLSAQISYYSAYIQKHPGWEYAGVYADNGISGTGKKNRPEFQRLLADCDAGRIDIVLTKSISRFARNTVDLLETVRHLRELGIAVQFEEQNINTLSSDGELILTILASVAQAESRSMSENQKWSIRKRFQQGIPSKRLNVFGYQLDGDKSVINPDEAEAVRLIFQEYISGKSLKAIAQELTEMGVRPRKSDKFSITTVRKTLENPCYTGDLVLQRYYKENYITHKKKENKGELPKYIITDDHEAIIDHETFAKAQQEMERRKGLGGFATGTRTRSVFTGKIYCADYGKHFTRSYNISTYGPPKRSWKCDSKKDCDKCPITPVPEKTIEALAVEVLELEVFDPTVFEAQIEKITVPSAHVLQFHFYDGRVEIREWQYVNFWTPERRAEWSEKVKDRWREDRRDN
jgi:DNA invertase Pin-like site-specific DNA recombinase